MMGENANNVRKIICKPHNIRGTARSQIQAISQLAASINKIININAKCLNVKKDDRLTLLKFRKILSLQSGTQGITKTNHIKDSSTLDFLK